MLSFTNRLQSTILLVLLCCAQHLYSKYPETLLFHALSRNHSTPSDLIVSIQKWILQPSDMTTNQLVQCRDSGQNIWKQQCADRIDLLLSQESFVYTPSLQSFALEIQDHGKRLNLSRYSRASGAWHSLGWKNCMKRNHVRLVFNIFARARNGRNYVGNRSIYLTGSRALFCISNQSVSVFGFKWTAVGAGYVIDRVEMSWYPVGYTVTDIVLAK